MESTFTDKLRRINPHSLGESRFQVSSSDRAIVQALLRNEYPLWMVVLAFWVVGDLLTTTIGLQISGVIEVGPVGRIVVAEFGVLGMIVFKIGFTSLFFAIAERIPDPHHVGVPVGLALVGIVVTTWNTVVFASAF